MDKKIPVTLISGFLGAGKTTLLNHILSEDHGLKIAVIENEFDSLGIDQEIIKGDDDMILEMNNGCLCCSVKDDLTTSLLNLLEKKGHFDYLIIEATGMANPGPICEVFMSDPRLKESFKMDSVISLVDAGNFKLNLRNSDKKGEFIDQIVFADLLILNKTDTLTSDEKLSVTSEIKNISQAPIIESEYCKIDLKSILNLDNYTFKKVEEDVEKGHHGHSHSKVSSVSFEFEGEINPKYFELFLNVNNIFDRDHIYRSKAVLNFENFEEKVIFQGVYGSFHLDTGKAWEVDKRINKFVFIGKDLDAELLKKGLMNCVI